MEDIVFESEKSENVEQTVKEAKIGRFSVLVPSRNCEGPWRAQLPTIAYDSYCNR